MVREKKKSTKSTTGSKAKSKFTKQSSREEKRVKKTKTTAKAKKGTQSAETIESAPVVESQTPDIAFARPALNAAFLKRPAHLRKTSDRMELGRAMRVQCPRESHSELPADAVSARDSVNLLVESSIGRIESLLPLRYGRMSASQFCFLSWCSGDNGCRSGKHAFN